MELRKFIAPEIVLGNGCRKLVGQYIKNFGVGKIMLVSDANVSSQEWFKDILESLDKDDIHYVMALEVSVNPRDYECHRIAESYQAEGCDLILAVGGGSVMDCAKAVGVLVNNGGDIRHYEGVDEILFPIPPLICIATTSGSAAEISQFAIITHTDENYKMALVSKALVPDLALLDPETTYTAPLDVTIDTGLDVLAHATEAIASNASSPMTDLHAFEAINLVLLHLQAVSTDLGDAEAREGMLRASMHAGLAFSNASLGLIHAIAHALGGRFDLIHGELNGLLIEEVVKFNYSCASEQFRRIEALCYEHLDMPKGMTLDEIYRYFIVSIRRQRKLSKQGVDKDKLMDTITNVLEDPCIFTNPREVVSEDVKMIYEKIW